MRTDVTDSGTDNTDSNGTGIKTTSAGTDVPCTIADGTGAGTEGISTGADITGTNTVYT